MPTTTNASPRKTPTAIWTWSTAFANSSLAQEANLSCPLAPQSRPTAKSGTARVTASFNSLYTPRVTIGSSYRSQVRLSPTQALKRVIREQTAAYGSIIKVRIRGSEEKHPCVTEFYVVSELGSFL